jgi:hypothetical protein
MAPSTWPTIIGLPATRGYEDNTGFRGVDSSLSNTCGPTACVAAPSQLVDDYQPLAVVRAVSFWVANLGWMLEEVSARTISTTGPSSALPL